MCARGNWFGLPHFSMVNSCGPLLPYNSAKPFIGTRDVPVTNCSNLVRISLFMEYTACKECLDFLKTLYYYLPASPLPHTHIFTIITSPHPNMHCFNPNYLTLSTELYPLYNSNVYFNLLTALLPYKDLCFFKCVTKVAT